MEVEKGLEKPVGFYYGILHTPCSNALPRAEYSWSWGRQKRPRACLQ